MHIFNPCKKCIIQAACTVICEPKTKHDALYDKVIYALKYIPISLINAWLYIVKQIKFILSDEPFPIQVLLTLLIMCELLVITLCVQIVILLFKVIFQV